MVRVRVTDEVHPLKRKVERQRVSVPDKVGALSVEYVTQTRSEYKRCGQSVRHVQTSPVFATLQPS